MDLADPCALALADLSRPQTVKDHLRVHDDAKIRDVLLQQFCTFLPSKHSTATIFPDEN